jgi:alkylhydroperoxidase family enzyme
MARIEPLDPPYEPEIDRLLTSMMPPDAEPIRLFRTFAHNPPMAEAMHGWGAYVLSRNLSLSMRDREIVIDRTTARCGAEYEWGVHIAFFADRVELDPAQVTSLVHGGPADPCWTSARDRLLIRTADALHTDFDVPDDLWRQLRLELSEAQCLDLALLCGWYHAISFVVRVTGVEREPGTPTFADVAP